VVFLSQQPPISGPACSLEHFVEPHSLLKATRGLSPRSAAATSGTTSSAPAAGTGARSAGRPQCGCLVFKSFARESPSALRQKGSRIKPPLSDFPLHAVRKMPSWPRSWANFSLLQLYSHRNAWANLHLVGQPNTFLACEPLHHLIGGCRENKGCSGLSDGRKIPPRPGGERDGRLYEVDDPHLRPAHALLRRPRPGTTSQTDWDTMRLDLSGSEIFEPFLIFSQNICSGAR
jgi:hypothetical protein